jgi:hypothetical protein
MSAGLDGADGIWWDTETPREDPSEAAGWTLQISIGGPRTRRRIQLAGARTDSIGVIAARAARVISALSHGHHVLPFSRRAKGLDGSIVIANARVQEAVAIPRKR